MQIGVRATEDKVADEQLNREESNLLATELSMSSRSRPVTHQNSAAVSGSAAASDVRGSGNGSAGAMNQGGSSSQQSGNMQTMDRDPRSTGTSASKLSLNPSAHTSAMLPSVPETRPAMDLTLVIALIQELIALSSSKKKLVIPKSMALLCSKLNVTWACLTAFSSTGQHYQHCGAAHVMHHEKLALAHPGFVACLENSGGTVPGASGDRGSGYSHTSCFTSRGANSSSREDAPQEGSESPRDSMSSLPQSVPPRPVISGLRGMIVAAQS